MSNPLTNNATRFRIVLIISLIASILVVVGVVIYGVQALNGYADKVNQQVIAANGSESTLSGIRSQVQQLQANQAAVERAKQIVADSKEYRYQDTIIRDIERFARRAGITIQGYDFTASSTAAAAPTAPAAPTEGPPLSAGAGEQPALGDQPAPASTLRSTVVTVSIESPVNYRNFLKFLNYVEQNLTKMQVASVSLASGDSSSAVTTGPLQIEVYVR